MTKNDIAKKLALKYNLPVEKTSAVLNDFIEIIGDELSKKNKVQLPGFGTFEEKEINERICRNPRTKEKIVVPSHFAPKFKAGKNLKEKVNE